MLKTRGLTAYGLHVKSKGKGKKAKARLHQSVISKIRHNKSKALQLDILDVLCELLDCQPADLIVYESTTQSAPTTQIVERATIQTAKHTQNVNATQTVSDDEPQDADMSKYYTRHKLKTRGWITVMIESLLGKPDFTKVRGGKNPQELYLVSRVEAMEKTKDFKESQERMIRRAADYDTYIASTTQSTKHTQDAPTTQSVSDNEKLLTTADIAERLGLSKKSVTDYINKGILPTIQPKGARTPHFVKESDYPAFELYYRNLTGKM